MQSRKKTNIDWVVFSIYLSLVAIGWAMIYTVGYGKGYTGGFFAFMDTPVGKQLIWVAIALGVFFLTYTIEAKFWRNFANVIYLSCLFLLLLVLVFGKTIKGATSWFDFGSGITLQPSEFAKFGTAIALASYLSSYANNLRTLSSKLYAMSFFMAPILLILLQPDAGSALVFFAFFIVLFREGFPAWVFVTGLIAAAVLVAGLVNPPPVVILLLCSLGATLLVWNIENQKLYWFSGLILAMAAGVIGIKKGFTFYALAGGILILIGLLVFLSYKKKQRLVIIVASSVMMGSILAFASNFAYEHFLRSHQKERILVWLKPSEADPQGAAYNLNHSKMAIGSGGLFGKGFLEGNFTQGNFVPEQITDFIFCAIGEEQGFVGSFLIIVLFLLLMWRIIFIAERQRSDFNRLYAYGVASVIFIHFFVNISMTMGLMPIIGIPLPFLSKGGSSLLGFTLMISVLLKLDAERS
jgi:rod shape determining protein RodA